MKINLSSSGNPLLDVTGWDVVYVAGDWYYMSKEEKMLSPGFGSREGLIKNNDTFLATKDAIERGRKRYTELIEGEERAGAEPQFPPASTASLNLPAFVVELRALLVKYGVAIGADVQGDTHGVTTNFVVRDRGGVDHVLCPYQSMADAYDLRDEE